MPERSATPPENVFLQPDENHRQGELEPEARVPVFYRVHEMAGWDGLTHLIEYWFFFAYNDGPLAFNHQGDWECVHAGIANDASVFYSLSHHGDHTRVRWPN